MLQMPRLGVFGAARHGRENRRGLGRLALTSPPAIRFAPLWKLRALLPAPDGLLPVRAPLRPADGNSLPLPGAVALWCQDRGGVAPRAVPAAPGCERLTQPERRYHFPGVPG